MMTTPGYTLIAPISEDADFVFYRATRMLDSVPVLLKIPAAADLSPLILSRLEYEYELAQDLDSDWIARPLALERHGCQVALVLKQGPTKALASLLGSPMDIRSFLRIAIGINTALGELHDNELVHKDIKPENVLLDEDGHVLLTGLGIASRLPMERQAPEPPEVIAGTLAYMAPEQTGRMNRSIDSRSDLYALGIIFYQMLTGVLPFTADDAMEWVHCHIARLPVPPIQRVPTLPEPLSEMVMKLLAKTAEERYQSAAGLDADLRHCSAQWESNGRIAPFPLGAHDTPDRFLVPEKLYGRQSEIDALIAAFNRVMANGAPELVLVSGYSGIGKTSVVHELHKALVPPRGLFAAGKFDQYKRDIPYATLVQALQSLVRHILGKSEAEVEQWRDALHKAVSPNGQLIVSLIPEVELIIGQQPPVPDLPPQEARNRFQMVLLRFIGVFTGPGHPLVLFLDDLQWLDAATLNLLTHLTTESELRGFLLVGAYRDNEVTPAHPLMRTIDTIRKGGASVRNIVLAPLTVNDVCCLVADALLCARERALPLAQLLHEKTGGNPFFAIQFLTALAEEKLLAFDRDTGRWIWNLARIHARNYTDNVVDLMTEKLLRLPAATREALEQVACLGNVAEIGTLAAVQGETEKEIRAALWHAVLAGLVFQKDNTYKFLHDRIQQAAYSLIPEEHRAEVHLRIGRALLTRMPADLVTERLFDIANHLNRGATLLSDRDEKAHVAEIDLRAGRKAKASTAYASACVYLAAGMALLDESDWESRYELMFSLWLDRAECEFLTGNFDATEGLIGELLRRGTSKVDLAAVYHLKVQVHVLKSENPQAVDSALTCLRLFDIDIPAHPSREQVQVEYDIMWRNLEKCPIESLIDLPLMTDPELLAAMQVLSVLLGPAYFTDIQLHRLHLCRMVNLSIQHGISGPSAHGCGFLGFILGPAFHRYDEAYRFGKLACDIAEKHSFLAYQARTYVAMALIALWTQPIETAVDFNRAAFHAATETGSPEMACYSLFHLLADLFLRNDPLDSIWRESEIALNYVRKAKFHDVADIIVSKQRLIAAMQGRTAALATFSDAHFDEAAFEARLTADRMPMLVSLYWIIKLEARYLSGDYTEALAAADKVKPMLWAAAAHIHLLDYFLYTALAVTALYEEVSEDKRSGWRNLLKEHREQLCEWAENYPPNFADKYALVSAEIARIEGRDMEAMRLYDQAIRSARDNDFVQQEALAAEVAARFYQARGFERIAETYLRDAHAGYARWGAQGKVRQLERLHPWLAHAQQPQTATLAQQLDAISVARAQRAISSEIHLDRLAQTLLRIVMESAGAQTGYLSVEGAGQLRAEMQPNDDGSQRIIFDASPLAGNIPEAIVNYVRRSRKAVILDDARAQAGEFSADDYLRRVKPRSVLGMAIQRQEKLLAVLYLENNLVSGAFTPEHRTVLEVLSAQAAISLETSAVYEALRESEERYRSLIRKVQTAIVLHDGQGQILDSNPLARELLGLSEDRLRGKSLIDPGWHFLREDGSIMPVAEYPASIVLSSQQALKGYVAGICRPDKEHISWVIVNAEPEYSSAGEISLVIVSFMDITERKQAEEDNAWNLAFNQALSSLYIPIVTAGTSIEQIADAVLEKSRQLTGSTHGFVGEIDPATGDLIAHTNTKMLQTECKIAEDELRKIRFPRRADGLYNGLWGHALNTKEPFFTDRPAKHPASVGIPEGHLVIERFLSVPVLLTGELVGQIALSNSIRAYSDRDLDAVKHIAEFYAIAIQQKRAELEIRVLNQELEQRVLDRTAELAAANQELEAFAYSVSHDLRAPVRHINGFLELLQKSAGTALNEQSQHYMATISGAAIKMSLLIDHLLSFSRMGRHAISSQKVELGSLVGDIIRELEPEAAGRIIDWHIGDLPTVGGDAAMLRIVLVNLITNALKFTRTRAQTRIEIGSIPGQTSEAVIFVRDNGVGFDMTYADKLFGVFQRLHRSDEFEGTGIGLANVRRIIARHGGRTWAQGEIEQGAAFFFSLPYTLQERRDSVRP